MTDDDFEHGLRKKLCVGMTSYIPPVCMLHSVHIQNAGYNLLNISHLQLVHNSSHGKSP